MTGEIEEVGADCLARYAEISIAYEVRSVFRAQSMAGGLGGMCLEEQELGRPYTKDYDAIPDNEPAAWGRHFDTRDWGFFLARDGAAQVGAAVVAWNTPEVHEAGVGEEEHRDVAVLWDIRVGFESRGQGIGRRLFERAMAWSRAKGALRLMAETQNVNVPASKFYAGMGCRLGKIDLYAYAGRAAVADEFALVWYYDL